MRPSKEFKLIIRRMFLGVVAVGWIYSCTCSSIKLFFKGTL